MICPEVGQPSFPGRPGRGFGSGDSLGGPAELPLYLLLGLLLAPICVLLIRAVIWQHDLWPKVHLSRPLRTALAGVIVGIVAIFFPQISGTGRDFMNALLTPNQTSQ